MPYLCVAGRRGTDGEERKAALVGSSSELSGCRGRLHVDFANSNAGDTIPSNHRALAKIRHAVAGARSVAPAGKGNALDLAVAVVALAVETERAGGGAVPRTACEATGGDCRVRAELFAEVRAGDVNPGSVGSASVGIDPAIARANRQVLGTGRGARSAVSFVRVRILKAPIVPVIAELTTRA
ncbi:MAG: hypothetical protein AMXMBFR22_33030 [Phycisphaerae bacterium]